MVCVDWYDYQYYYHLTLAPAFLYLILHHFLDYWYTKKLHLIPPFQYLMNNDRKRIYYLFTMGALGNTFIWNLGTGEIIDIKGDE